MPLDPLFEAGTFIKIEEEGWYRGEVVEAIIPDDEYKRRVQVTVEVTDGEYTGGRANQTFWMESDYDGAVERDMRKLYGLALVCGLKKLESKVDSVEDVLRLAPKFVPKLEGKPLWFEVAFDKENYAKMVGWLDDKRYKEQIATKEQPETKFEPARVDEEDDEDF